MAEQFKSITEARKDLPTLSQTVQGGGDRFVITNQGKPQAVLLGWGEYKGLMAAAELLNRPKALADLEEGMKQTRKLSFAELKENLQRRKAQSESEISVTVAKAADAEPAVAIDEKLEAIKFEIALLRAQIQENEQAAHMGRRKRGSARGRRDHVSGSIPQGPKKSIQREVTEVRRGRTDTPAEAATAAEAQIKAGR
jgi:PHD/YefM family antitoxin component YafN of YafNO toxin-antitoxin module